MDNLSPWNHDEIMTRESDEGFARGFATNISKPTPLTDADRKRWSIDEKMNKECDCTADELFAGSHYASCKWVLGMTPEELATTSKQII